MSIDSMIDSMTPKSLYSTVLYYTNKKKPIALEDNLI